MNDEQLVKSPNNDDDDVLVARVDRERPTNEEEVGMEERSEERSLGKSVEAMTVTPSVIAMRCNPP